jgi:hypothetical protein
MILRSTKLTQGKGFHTVYSSTHLVLYMREFFEDRQKMKGSPSDDIFSNNNKKKNKKRLSAFEKQNLLDN